MVYGLLLIAPPHCYKPIGLSVLIQDALFHLRIFIYVIFPTWKVLYTCFCLVNIYSPVRSQLNCKVLRKGLPDLSSKYLKFNFFVIMSL